MRIYLLPLAVGLIGVLLGLSAWHLYVDHATWHALINDVARQNQQQQK